MLDRPFKVTIQFRPPTAEKPQGYIGASFTSDPAPGEDWRRGNDLSDGAWTEETALKVFQDMLGLMQGNPFGRHK